MRLETGAKGNGFAIYLRFLSKKRNVSGFGVWKRNVWKH